MLGCFSYSDITQVFLLFFNLNPGHLLWAQCRVCTDKEVHQVFSISLIDLVCKGSEDRITSVCLMK